MDIQDMSYEQLIARRNELRRICKRADLESVAYGRAWAERFEIIQAMLQKAGKDNG